MHGLSRDVHGTDLNTGLAFQRKLLERANALRKIPDAVHRISRLARLLLLSVAVVLSLVMLRAFIREQLFLWQAREEGAGIHLLFEPRFRIFRLPPSEGGRITWHSSTGEPMEGSTWIFSVPSWPLAAVAIGILIYAAIVILDTETWRRKTRSN